MFSEESSVLWKDFLDQHPAFQAEVILQIDRGGVGRGCPLIVRKPKFTVRTQLALKLQHEFLIGRPQVLAEQCRTHEQSHKDRGQANTLADRHSFPQVESAAIPRLTHAAGQKVP